MAQQHTTNWIDYDDQLGRRLYPNGDTADLNRQRTLARNDQHRPVLLFAWSYHRPNGVAYRGYSAGYDTAKLVCDQLNVAFSGRVTGKEATDA